MTPALFDRLGLNQRQRTILATLRSKKQVTNAEYQKATGAARATAKRDLEELVRVGLLKLVGAGRGAAYVLAGKRLRNGSIGSAPGQPANGSKTAQSARTKVKPSREPKKRKGSP